MTDPESSQPPPDEQPPLKPKPSRRGPRLQVPGYQIQGVIGRGSTGTVYRARQENVDRVVALKVLHLELSSRPRMVSRLQREARTTARLAHPHIVTAIDMGRTGDRWWFAMELVDGPSLALKLRQEGRLSERDALRFFIPLCEALVHIWENGVVHRDIKPANILIDRVAGAQLADLGLAFADDDPHLTGSEATLGTPHYISPEQARDPSSVDIRTDIWSFGATLFHAVCGEPPLQGANVAEVLSGVLYGRIPDPVELEPDLSRGLALVLRKCLSRDFERRYQSPRELLRDLERVRERRKPRVRSASLEPTSGKQGRGMRVLFAIALFGLFGAGGVLLLRRPWDVSIPPAVYEPLGTLERRIEAGGETPGVLLDELTALRPELPAGDLKGWRAAVAGLRKDLREILGEVLNESEARFENMLEAGDFSGAAGAIGADLEPLLIQRAGVSLATVPTEFGLGIVNMGNRLERSLEQETRRLRDRLEGAFADPFLVEMETLISQGRWRAAAERLGVSPGELAEQLGVDFGALSQARTEQLIGYLSGRLANAHLDLNQRWTIFDEELVRWVEFTARNLSNELSANLKPISAGARLRDGFDQELRRRGTARELLLSDPFGLARPRLLDEAAGLEEYERRLMGGRETSGRETIDSLAAWLDESATGEAYRERRYEAVESFWLQRKQWLAANAAAAPWWVDLERLVQLRLGEVQLLLDLRKRAELQLLALDGRSLELHMSADVAALGELQIQAPGAAGGMGFIVGPDARYEFYLSVPLDGLPAGAHLLQAVDFEALGRVDSEPALDVLTRGVFRFREGDLDGAHSLLQQVDLAGPRGAMAAELVRGLERNQTVLAQSRRRRLGEARSLLATLYFGEDDQLKRLGRDPFRALSDIQRLLVDFGDLKPVVARQSDLKALEQRFQRPDEASGMEAFEQVFGAGIVRFPSAGRAELFFDFAAVEVPGLSSGDWTPDGAGWLSPGSIASDEQLLGHGVPRLALASPLKLDAAQAVCEFTFMEPISTGGERLVLAEAAGFKVLIQTKRGAAQSVVHVGIGGAGPLLQDLRSGGGHSIPRALLVGGKAHVLRIEFEKRRGRLRVILDDQPILERDLSPPPGQMGAGGVSLRAREQVRLLSLRVVADR